MSRVSTARTRAAKRELIAAQAASPNFRIRWGRVAVTLLALVSFAVWAVVMAVMAGAFMDRL